MFISIENNVSKSFFALISLLIEIDADIGAHIFGTGKSSLVIIN